MFIFSLLPLYVSWSADKENLFKDQELYELVITSLILMTLMFDSGVILWGEIRSWSLLGVKGLRLEKGPLDNKFHAPAIKPAFLHEFLTVPHDSSLFSDCLSLLLWFWSHDTNWNTLTIALNIVFDNIVACRAGVIVASEGSEFSWWK